MSQEKETSLNRTPTIELEAWLVKRILQRKFGHKNESQREDDHYEGYTAGLQSVLNYIREEL